MKQKFLILFAISVCLPFFFGSCGQRNILDKMKKQVPIYKDANVLESYTPEKNVGVIKMEVDTSKATQKDILDFYKEAMVKKGWELKDLKDYGKNGSVMELVKKDTATLTVMTIMKQTEKTGKIPVTLNLTKL